jgi:hypothetical protein
VWRFDLQQGVVILLRPLGGGEYQVALLQNSKMVSEVAQANVPELTRRVAEALNLVGKERNPAPTFTVGFGKGFPKT